jgi:hypothetical protein
MRSFFRKAGSLAFSVRGEPWFLLAVAILAYGLFIWQYGFYWDDLPISWIRYQLGPEAMEVYFSTSRPVWGMLYQITTRLLPQVPVYWQIFALLWRWIGVVILWAVLREIWPGRRQMALIVSLLFLLYPGFNLQWVSFLSSHFFIVICIFLFSYLLMLWALKNQDRFLPLTLLALIFSVLNLWMMEYFYFLELIRPFIIFYVLYQTQWDQRFWSVVRRTFLYWLPYLLVFLVNVFYRTFVFTNVAYENELISNLRADPMDAILTLAKGIRSDLWVVSVEAWQRVFQFPVPAIDGPRTTLLYGLVVLAAGVLVFFMLIRYRDERWDYRPALWAIGIGFVALLLGGGPFWLADLKVALAFPASRFTMPYMLGVSLILAGLLELVPARIRLFFAVVLVSLAAGRHVIAGDAFRRDWQTHRNLFWQMSWRVPGLKPNTLVLMNEELSFYADNSLSASLNWIFAPDNHTDHIDYVLLYPTNRLRSPSLPALQEDIPVHFSYIAGRFEGNTSQALAFYYSPPGCLRVLDPEIERVNRLISEPTLMRYAARLSSLDLISRETTARMPEVYAPEPEHGWCYYFQKADLAGQFDDWEQVVELGDKAFALDDFPNDPVERFVFIEGYAHAGGWERAIELSDVSYRVSKDYVGPLLCRLWERIERETVESPDRDGALSKVKNMFACNP